jgi:hypothetical protein
MVAIVFAIELPRNIRAEGLRKVTVSAVYMATIILILGNVTIYQGLSFLFMFSGLSKTQGWFHWYLDQPPVTWVGGFLAGLLVGGPQVSIVVVSIAAVVVVITTVCLIYLRQFRAGMLALIGVSTMAVAYIELAAYQYGEHKILQLLGPSWTFATVIASGYLYAWVQQKVNDGNGLLILGKVVASGMMASLIFVISDFSWKSISLLSQQRGSHSLDFGLDDVAKHVGFGDSVLIDDHNWIGMEKFIKSHYIASKLKGLGAKPLMPSIESDGLRGGYMRGELTDTLKNSKSVEWVILSKGYTIKSDISSAIYGKAVWENDDYKLYKVERQPVVVMANGWHDCEPMHCWTSSPVQLETFVPSSGQYELAIDFAILPPPKDWAIFIRTDSGEVLKKIDSAGSLTKVTLPAGWMRLSIEANWPISSPKDLNMSSDSRKLFASIRGLTISKVVED